MKLKLLALLLLVAGSAFSQLCTTPMPATIFKQKLNQLALQPNDQQKLQLSNTILQGACLLSSQVKDLAMVFTGDYYRFEFCKRAWKHTFDPGNFFDVYDAFGSMSAAMRLYDHVSRQEPYTPQVPATGPASWFPDLAYPVTFGYNGATGCRLPLADKDFEVLCKSVVMQHTDATRRSEAMKLAAAHCISMGQAMKLSTLFELESARLAFLKEVFPKVHDLENYSFVTEVFSHMPYKNDWLAYCASVLEPAVVTPPPPVTVCEVTAVEMGEIKHSISNVAVNSTKLTLAKQIISTKKCFTVKQIASIIELLSVESSRLDVAKHAYGFCTNKGDYYQLTESLVTTSSKNELLQYINNQK